MSTVQSVPIDRAAGSPERKTAPEGAEFAAIFAHFASRSTLDVGAAGRLTLALAGGGGAGAGAGAAQDWGAGPAATAQDETAPDDPGRSAARERQADRADSGVRPGRSEMRTGGVQSWSAATQEQRAGVPSNPPERAPTPHTRHDNPALQGAGPPASEPGGNTPAGLVTSSSERQAATARAGAPTARAIAAAAGPPGVSASGPANGQGLLSAGTGVPSPGARPAARSAEHGAPPAPNTREPTAFRAQLAQGLAAALRRGEGEVILRLRPEALGEVRVQLSVRASTVDAHIRTTTGEAHRLLEQSLDTLRAALEARGLHVGRIELEPGAQDVRHDSAAAEPQQHHASPEGGRERDDASRESAPERGVRGGAAEPSSGPQDDGPTEARALGSMDHPGVVYGVADGAARILMIDALA